MLYVLPIEVAGKEKIIFHVFIGNEVTGNSIRKIEIIFRSVSIFVPVHKHLTQSLGQTLVAGMLMKTDALADWTTLKHHCHWRDNFWYRIVVLHQARRETLKPVRINRRWWSSSSSSTDKSMVDIVVGESSVLPWSPLRVKTLHGVFCVCVCLCDSISSSLMKSWREGIIYGVLNVGCTFGTEKGLDLCKKWIWRKWEDEWVFKTVTAVNKGGIWLWFWRKKRQLGERSINVGRVRRAPWNDPNPFVFCRFPSFFQNVI